MNKYLELIVKILNWLGSNAALVSVAVTLLLFFLSKKKENELKIYETKKNEYMKLIDMFEKIFSSVKEKEDIAKKMSQKDFYDVGSSLALFGSRKLYKTYCLYRELSVNEHWQSIKYYDKEMVIFLWGDMYQIMRKEIGLNTGRQYVAVPDIMFFMLNDITKPEYRKKYYEYKYRKVVFKLLILFGKINENLPIFWMWNILLKPFLFCCYGILYMFIKTVIYKPLKFIIKK